MLLMVLIEEAIVAIPSSVHKYLCLEVMYKTKRMLLLSNVYVSFVPRCGHYMTLRLWKITNSPSKLESSSACSMTGKYFIVLFWLDRLGKYIRFKERL